MGRGDYLIYNILLWDRLGSYEIFVYIVSDYSSPVTICHHNSIDHLSHYIYYESIIYFYN